MKTEEILTALRSRGAYVRLLEGQRLGVEPASVLTDDLRAEIRAHKTELIQVLRKEDGPLGAASALLTTADLAHLKNKSAPMIEAMLNTLAAFPGARVLQ